jgi:hypothetical protein
MEDEALAFDQRPFERRLRAEYVEAFAILPRGIEQAPIDADANIGVTQRNMRRLDREGRPISRDKFFTDAARTKT